MIDTLVIALGMGAAGSVHCAAMCGPLAIGGCTRRADTAGYFGGRALSYALFGAIAGALGRAIALGPIWSLAIAAAMLIYGLHRLRPRRDPSIVSLPRRRNGALAFLARMFPRRGLGLGLATGLLPCGLLAGAWMLAASTAHPLTAALVMLAFSIGSLPGLVGSLVAKRFATKLVCIPPFASGVLWCALAVWIAARPFLFAGAERCH